MQLHQDVVDSTIRSQHALYQCADNNPAQKVRKIGNGLRNALEGTGTDFIEQKREHNGKEKTENQVHHGHDHGVAECPPELKISEQKPELVQSDKLRPPVSLGRTKILKSHDPAGKRIIRKDKSVNHAWDDHKIQRLTLGNTFPQTGFLHITT